MTRRGVLTWIMAGVALLQGPAAPAALAQTDAAVTPLTSGGASGISASAGVSPDTVTLGDHFRVRIRVVAERGTRVEFPAFRLVEPVEEADTLRVAADGDGSWIATYTLAAWTVSDSLIGNFPIRVRTGQEAPRDLRIRVSLPVVRSVLPADSSLHLPRPARPPLPIAMPATHPRDWTAPVALLLALTALIVWLLWRRRAMPAVALQDAREAALSALTTIEDERLPERGLHHEYHVRTSRVLRQYIQAMGGGGEELTSTELVAAMRRYGVEEGLVAKLADLLRESDRVKFAGAQREPDARAGGAHGLALRRWIGAWPPAPPETVGGRAEAA